MKECVPDSTGLARDEMSRSGAELVRYVQPGEQVAVSCEVPYQGHLPSDDRECHLSATNDGVVSTRIVVEYYNLLGGSMAQTLRRAR